MVRYFTKSVNQGTSPWVIAGAVTFAGPLAVTQSGVWSVGRTWTLNFATDSVTVFGTVGATQSGAWTVAATQSGAWNCGRTWSLASGSDSVACVQSGAWNVTAAQGGAWTVAATQSGAWTTGRTWTLNFATDSVACMPTSYNMTIAGPAYLTSRNTGDLIQLGDPLLLTNSALSAQDTNATFMPLGNLSRAPTIHGELSAQPKNWYYHIVAQGPAPISATPCVLHTLTINKFPPVAMAITITDGVNIVAVITTPAFATPTFWTPPVTLHYDVACSTSLTVAVACLGAFDLTVAFVN